MAKRRSRRAGNIHSRSEHALLQELDGWEAQQVKPPTLFDVVATRRSNLLAAYVLRCFRAAAKDAVKQRQRVSEVRHLAGLAFGDAAIVEEYLRSEHPALGCTPLEAAVASEEGTRQAIGLLTPHVRAVALKLFRSLAERWQLSSREQLRLLDASANQFSEWARDPANIPDEAVERVSLLIAVYKALAVLLPDEKAAHGWVKAKNTARLFAGQTALDVMLADGSAGMRQVRDYLEAQIWSV